MRCVMTAAGSRGDVQQIVDLARALRGRGHHVTLVLAPIYQSAAQAIDAEFLPIGPDVSIEDQQACMRRMLSAEDAGTQFAEFLKVVLVNAADAITSLSRAGRNADVMITAATQPVAGIVCERLGLPLVSIQYGAFGPWHAAPVRKAAAPSINAARVRAGLGPQKEPFAGRRSPRDLNIYAVSKCFVSDDRDHGDGRHAVGFFYSPVTPWQPPKAFDEFVTAAEPPVFVTFGSMMHSDPARVSRAVIRAVLSTGHRLILQRGSSELALECDDPRVYVVDYVPYSWMFPRVACVVHHASCGTSAWVFREGIPAVTVPHVLDQFIWARQAETVGCSAGTVPIANLDEGVLARHVDRATRDPRIREAALTLRGRIELDGVERAAELVESRSAVDSAASSLS